MTSWIGKPLAKNKPHNFFKTSKKDYPVNMFKDSDRDGVANVFDCKPYNPNKEGFVGNVIKKVGEFGKKVVQRTAQMPSNLQRAVARSHPKYRLESELRRTKLSKEAKSELRERFQQAKTARKQLAKSVKRVVYSTFPGATPYTETGKVSGVPGRVGRPKGTLDPRYAAYGGVFGYRRYLSQKRREFKEKMRLQEEMMKRGRMPQYEQMQEVPQEVKEAVPEYSQFPQEQAPQEAPQVQIPQRQYQPTPQYQQYQQQYQPQQTSKEDVPVFKSSGGKPYPAVERRPLTPSRQTIQSGYVEVADSFSGRRYMKKVGSII